MTRAALAFALLGAVLTVFANTESPYSGQEQRPIKALSQEEVEAYLEGKGMGYAKAAELNHYPGPLHVLEMADQLGLSHDQIAKTRDIFDTMKKQAMVLGRQLVDQEHALDQAFASGSLEPESLVALVGQIGKLEAEIRFVHLNAHLQQKSVLTRQQVMQYDKLRGYGMSGHAGHDHDHQH